MTEALNQGRMLNGDNAPLSEDSDADQENNMGMELIGLGFLVLNKAQTIGTSGWNGVTPTL